MLDWIGDPLTYGFMQRGLMASVVVGLLCSVVGCFVVLRGMAYLGDAIAHAVLPGVAVAYVLRADLTLGAMVAAFGVAAGIGWLSRQGRLREDTAIGIVFAGSLALGVALISTIRTYAQDLTHILFGNVLGVSTRDLWLAGSLGSLVLALVVIFYRELMLISFDPVFAATLRIPAERFRVLLLMLLAATVVVSMQVVGVGLVTAMLVTPAAAAYLLVKRLPQMMLLAAFIGVGSNVTGLYLSFYVNVASGAAMVLVATLVFLLVFLFSPGQGQVWRLWPKGSRPKSLR